LVNQVNSQEPVAVAYCAPERLTAGTYNLYLIAVHKDFQGKGIGSQLMNHVELLLNSQGYRVLLVETSGLPEFELTRKFYDKCNYSREAVIRDFYDEGEDKVIFWKKLS
jgi:ribosomal protein S18 acetylase RimI-like enzyme